MCIRDRFNQAPYAEYDFFSTGKNEALVLSAKDLLSNDWDPENDALSITGVDVYWGGAVVANANGTYTFTPESGYTGYASFEYKVSDGEGNTSYGWVDIDVGAQFNQAPYAEYDFFSTGKNEALVLSLIHI